MLENMPRPIRAMKVAPKAKFRSVNTARSKMGSFAMSSRRRKPTSARPATIASVTIRAESNQSSRSPRSRKSWRQPKPRTIRTRPGQSTRDGFFRYDGSKRQALAMKKPRRDRQVDVEDPPPGPVVGDVAAERRPDDRPHHEADAPHRHRQPPLAEREDLP